jgi:hypothetical protein
MPHRAARTRSPYLIGILASFHLPACIVFSVWPGRSHRRASLPASLAGLPALPGAGVRRMRLTRALARHRRVRGVTLTATLRSRRCAALLRCVQPAPLHCAILLRSRTCRHSMCRRSPQCCSPLCRRSSHAAHPASLRPCPDIQCPVIRSVRRDFASRR